MHPFLARNMRYEKNRIQQIKKEYNKMYLLIFEDGSLGTVATITDDLIASADDGILDIVDISGDLPLQYFGGEWNDIEEYGSEYHSGN